MRSVAVNMGAGRPYQMEDCSPMETSPMTAAEGAMNPCTGSFGTAPQGPPGFRVEGLEFRV